MKSRVAVLVVALAAFSALTLAVGENAGETWASDEALSPEDIRKHDFTNMSPTQILEKVSMLHSRCGISYLEGTAYHYMEEQDWALTEVVGYFKSSKPESNSTRPQLVAYRGDKVYLLEATLLSDPLDPGLYWSKGWGTAWEILTPDGDKETFWVKDSR